ncbi:MFS transporter [Bacillus sp. V33-4]|nr:MFS transporter [Bacillus sp. V33-4]
MQLQRRNLMIMWFANFLVAASATMILPFLSLYIETMGAFSDDYVQRWSGFVFGITFLAAFFISPLWGRFGDKHGYKPILIITGFGIASCIFLMGLVDSVQGLFILRLAMGVVTGFIPTSLALISSQTRKEVAGKTLGTLQMGTVSGSLLGPLIGGMMADIFGFQYTFLITSFVIALATVLVAVGIKEKRREKAADYGKSFSRKDVVSHIFHNRVLLTIMILSLLVNTANFSIQPLLALYVNQLNHSSNIAFLAGLAFSATGFGDLLFTRSWGKLGDSAGHDRVLMILLVLSALLFIPQGLVESLWQLILCRFLFGVAIGGVIPCITAYIRQMAPLAMQGEILGYNVSFQFMGNVIGPAMGGLLSGLFGISTVFFVTSALFVAAFGLLWWSVRKSGELAQSSS